MGTGAVLDLDCQHILLEFIMQPSSGAAHNPSGYYLCVDCGGSKTAVTITDSSGAIRARTNGGPSNFSYLGLDGFLKEVQNCVEAALRECGIESSKARLPVKNGEESHFAAAWFGVSGVDTPEAVAEITPSLTSLLSIPTSPPHFILANDTTLLAAPLVTASKRDPPLRTCVAAVGGTGSTSASFRLVTPAAGGEPVPQEIARIGGWGWILGDEGGGFHIGREAIRQLLRQHETAILSGKPLSPPADDPNTFELRTRVLSLFGVKSAPELLALIHDADPSEDFDSTSAGVTLPIHRTIPREKRLSQLAPLVIRAAFGDSEGKGGGDPLALSVLKATSEELAGQIALLLEPPTGPTSFVPLAIPAKSSLLVFGGSLVGIPKYRDSVLEALKSQGHEFAAVEHISNAAETGGRVLSELFNSKKES
ncbi:hypothetical protein A7U60_g3422 [Sanghuangporus baumii]|uniref:GlcNAc kinase n=1 Tax=Sanghuangporus baumii TaxID=108892 RepID=A0A9Q5I0T9_SANBA|nr:hypothetical protein A7U60_g3422 [Sanghuangporus baumii]